jgi:DNA-binding Lrp family transcriptional regulator
MKALILVKFASLEGRDAYDRICRLQAVRDTHLLYGRYDAVLTLQGRDLEELHDIILKEIQPVQGVIEILPCIIVEHEIDTLIEQKPKI